MTSHCLWQKTSNPYSRPSPPIPQPLHRLALPLQPPSPSCHLPQVFHLLTFAFAVSSAGKALASKLQLKHHFSQKPSLPFWSKLGTPFTFFTGPCYFLSLYSPHFQQMCVSFPTHSPLWRDLLLKARSLFHSPQFPRAQPTS